MIGFENYSRTNDRGVMNIKPVLFLFLAWVICLPAAAGQPKLVLQITVDQLRGDMPFRIKERFGPGGFRYLLEHGTVYTNAQYQHANTSTAVGHATLATGGNVPEHGMVGNDWWDFSRQEKVNCVEDRNSPLIGRKPGKNGRSPRNLESSTFSDELVLSNNGRSRAFAVSTKDRGAILLAGQTGKAYWYSKQNGEYVTSTWYHDSSPEWLSRWNANKPVDRLDGWAWTLLQEPESYLFSDHPQRSWVRPRGSLGDAFPHRLEKDTDGVFYSALRYTPATDTLTLGVARALIQAEKIGQGDYTDYLSISFSAADYIGHAFGPNSLEAEDNLLRLDRSLANLFAFVDQQVGLANTLVVLSSDHGVAPAPEYSARHGFNASRLGLGRHLDTINRSLMQRFGTEETLLRAFLKPNLYLDFGVMARGGLDVGEVERALVEEIQKLDGVGAALTRSQLTYGQVPDTPMARRMSAAFHPQRSGNVMFFPDPFWYLSDKPHGDAATHGTPQRYDTYVPMMFAGAGVPTRTVHRSVAPRDVAPTLSAFMGIAAPSGSVGVVLYEIIP